MKMKENRNLVTGLINTRILLLGFSFPFGEDADAVLNDAITRMTPKQIETEGGGHTWWHVCPECHGAIDSQDHYCRHCGQAVEE